MPVKLAGMRIEPPPSVPSASGAKRAATAAADPPEEPPGVLSLFQGLRVVPVSGLSVEPFQPNSGVVVLPSRTAPASRRRATDGASSVHGPFGSTVSEPRRVAQPLVSSRSLMATGTPSSGDSGSPSSQRFSDASAIVSVAWTSIWQKALIEESSASMRPRHASVTSTGESSRDSKAAESSAAFISCGSMAMSSSRINSLWSVALPCPARPA